MKGEAMLYVALGGFQVRLSSPSSFPGFCKVTGATTHSAAFHGGWHIPAPVLADLMCSAPQQGKKEQTALFQIELNFDGVFPHHGICWDQKTLDNYTRTS